MWRFGDKAVPVLLDEPSAAGREDAPDEADEPPSHLPLVDWNARERGYLMPVITPCRPRICSTHHVSKATLAVLRAEIARANHISLAAVAPAPPRARLASTPPASSPDDPDELKGDVGTPEVGVEGRPVVSPPPGTLDDRWAALFEPTDFFRAYASYVAVQISAASDVELLHWKSYVRAQLRRLVVLLEHTAGVEWVHPLPWPMRSLPIAIASEPNPSPNGTSANATITNDIGSASAESLPTEGRASCCFFVGLRFAAADGTASARGAGRVVDLRPAGTAFVELGTKWAERSAHCPTARMLVRHTARSELPTSLRTRDATQLPFEDEQDAAAMVGVQGTLT